MRFRISCVPASWKDKPPASMLFFEKIAETNPAQWAGAFRVGDANGQLYSQYAKNQILETIGSESV
jgi:hypothetical protein